MCNRSLVLSSAIALALFSHASNAVDIVSGSSFVRTISVPGGYESSNCTGNPTLDPTAICPSIGTDEIYNYWNTNPGANLSIKSGSHKIMGDINLGVNGGQSLALKGTAGGDTYFYINSNITGSSISGEGGSLYLQPDDIYTSVYDDIGVVLIGDNAIGGTGSISDVDVVNVNAQAVQMNIDSSIMLGEGDSFRISRYWIDAATNSLVNLTDAFPSNPVVFDNRGSIEQLGAGSAFEVDGIFLLQGSSANYTLQGGSLNTTKTMDISDGASFEQFAGTTNTVEGGISIDGSSTYLMHGGQLTTTGVSSHQISETLGSDGSGGWTVIGIDVGVVDGRFNYTDGGVRLSAQDLYIREGGLLGQDIVMDSGESFGAKNMYLGTLNDGLTDFGGQGVGALASGSIIMNGGSNRVVENMVIGQQAMMTQNSGSNSIGGNLNLNGGVYTQNDGGNTVDGTISMSSGGVYTLNNGSLRAGNISGSFNYVNGGVRLTNGSINIRSNGLLGQDLLIDENETFGAVNMTVGTLNADSGSINQSTGRNLIQGELRIEAGGNYDMSGGRLEIGSFAGPGKINFTAGQIYAGSDMNIGSAGPFGESLVLDSSKTLSLQEGGNFRNPRNNLTIDSGADLVLDGGELIANQIINTGNFNYVSGLLDLNSMTFGGTGALGSFTVTNDHSFYIRNDITIEAGTTVNIGSVGAAPSSGSLNGGATITNSGNLVLNDGSLNVSQINNIGAGSFNFNRGSLSLDTLNVGSAGLLGQTVSLNSSKNISATNVNVEANSRLEIIEGSSTATNLNNQGVVVVAQNGQLNGSAYTQDNAAATTTIDGELNANVEIADGLIGGIGIINGNLFNGGDFGPGASPGTMIINGDFTQTETGTLSIELGGLLPGSQYDVVDVSGIANLGGTLDISFYDLGSGLFSAELGDTFDILMAETIIGEFDLLTLALLGNGLGWDLSYVLDDFGTDYLSLSVVETSAVPVPAAVWLFGSGLIGLVGMARRKKA